MTRESSHHVFEMMQSGLKSAAVEESDSDTGIEATTRQTRDFLIATLNRHPHIQSLQEKHLYAQTLPLDEELLTARSRDYASYALRRAVRLGILNDKQKNTAEPVNIEELAHRMLLLRGQDHYLTGTECQDEIVVWRDDQSFIAVVCDGAGAFELSHFGSRLISREALRVFKTALEDELSKNIMGGSFLNRNFLTTVHRQMYLGMHELVCELGMSPGNAYKTFLATTLQVMIVTPKETAVLALGDGFLSWKGQLECLSDRTQRPARLRRANHPPLLICGLAFDAGAKPIRKSDAEIKVALHTEAMCFDIVAYAPTSELLVDGIEMSSDGLRFCDEVTNDNEADATLFPLHKLLVKHPVTKVIEMANLFNLAGEVEEGETKLNLVLEALAKDEAGNEIFPEISKKLKAFVSDQFARYIASDAKLRAFLDKSSGYDSVKFLLNGNHQAAKDGKQSIQMLEQLAVELAMQTVTRNWGIPCKGFFKPMWDDIAIIQITPTRGS